MGVMYPFGPFAEPPSIALDLISCGVDQASALQLPSQINVFSLVPPGTACRVPSVPTILTTINDDLANILPIYPPVGDRFYRNKINAPILLEPGTQIMIAWQGTVLAPPPHTWVPYGLGVSATLINSGFAKTGLTASGTTQLLAAPLPGLASFYTSVPAGTGAVILPIVGTIWDVWNADPVNTMLIWPFVGAQIGALGTNNPAAIIAGGRATFGVNSLTQVLAR
jgi:hypothetical protein